MNKLNWHCIKTNPRKENTAAQALNKLGIEICLPLVKAFIQTKYRNYTDNQAFFPSYLFARFIYTPDLFYSIRNTHHVHSILRQYGAEPLVVEDEIIDALASQMDEKGFITIKQEPLKVYSDLKLNEDVMIEAGPLAGFIGKLTSLSKGKDRVMVLLSIFGREKEVPLHRSEIRELTYSE